MCHKHLLRLTKLTRGVRSTSLGLRHIAQKAAQRRVSKTLYAKSAKLRARLPGSRIKNQL